ncbi:hypothetical protein Cni_G15642 [Canna indica]|uniref:DUF674 domain-containing protein n=1 Tax=Canna indica TaxID=4628 RepID=A0AAQ3KEH8_9LILI|nr:hypothetical protein Cni_G15642 [Canna indica]
MATTQITVKLLVDKTARKVLFAEAGKDGVDFLIGLLQIPIGSVVKLLTTERMVGAIGKLYKSMEDLDDSFLLSKNTKSLLLNPTCPTSQPRNSLFLLPSPNSSSEYYKCTRCSNNISRVCGTTCPSCRSYGSYSISAKVNYVEGSSTEVGEASDGGYVKGVVIYTVMDDLSIMPMSTISCITLLNKFNVKHVGTLEEKIVKLGFEEGLQLLKASLESKTVLTDVFLTKKYGNRRNI